MVSPSRLNGCRGFLSDTPSRYDAILARRRRQSFGGRIELTNDVGSMPSSNTPRHPVTRSIGTPKFDGADGAPLTRSRRQSMLGESSFRSESPIRDRRPVLSIKSHNRFSGRDDTDAHSGTGGDMKKRTRSHDAPPLPPTYQGSSLASVGTGSYFSRKQPKLRQYEGDENSHYSLSSARSTHADESFSETSRSRGSLLTQSPSFSRRSSRAPTIPPAIEHEESFRQDCDQPLSQLSVDLDDENKHDGMVEDAGLHSQLHRMKQRIDQLEKEKMNLSMSMAPLEARMRQKEEAWLKEKARLMQEIEDCESSRRNADERHRDLEVKIDDLQSENKQLRMDARKASQTRLAPLESAWSKELQEDRDLDDIHAKLKRAEEEIDSTRLAKVSVEKELHATKIAVRSLTRNYDELLSEYNALSSASSENQEAEIKLRVLTDEHMATSAQLNAVVVDLASTKALAEASMKAKEDEHKEEIEKLQFEMSVLKSRAGKIIDEPLDMSVSDEDEAVLRARIEERNRRISELEIEIQRGEQLRRQMHNTIQELRGNIRVYVRARPFLPGDKQSSGSPIDCCPDGTSLTIMDPRSSSPLDFKFDKVFPPSAGQDIVFNEVSDFVQSALDGYSVCLFSYGQTGSGKTHTMQGCGNGAMRGIIPRAVEKILGQAQAMASQKWEFSISASFLEIYNETLRDLLVSLGPKKKSNPKLAIKRTKEGRSFVDGLTEAPIETGDSDTGTEQLSELMTVATRSRSVASTKMNAQSSRSHSLFILHLRGVNNETGAVVHGTLNLCDLAGSERLDRSGAGADQARLKETQAINKSLSCLGDVFNSLATGASHVPFRNSKLTYLLQDCLSGDGKALMMVNMSPTTASSSESVCSLRFAQRVNKVELGKATKNIQYVGKGKK